jgi:UPF0042 nucleotide-binding protein
LVFYLQEKERNSIKNSEQKRVILLTGVSGSGLTTAMTALSDAGFYCIDNLPVVMIGPTFDSLDITQNDELPGYAFGVHLHDQKSVDQFKIETERLKKETNLDLLFLTADQAVLIDRYSTTRRPHPLLRRGGSFHQVIRKEKEILHPIEEMAHAIIDTTELSHHDLVLKIVQRYSREVAGRKLNISIISFGFKYGQHRPLDSMFDVRFLQNPYFVLDLKEKTGLDSEVVDYIMDQPISQQFLKKFIDWHLWILPKYYDEGKHYFRIGVGCTGGKHRSVCMAEQLASAIEEMKFEHIVVNVAHRDVEN